MGRRVRKAILLSAAAIFLACIGFVVYVARPFLDSGSYKHEIEKIRAKGEPVSAKDLAGPKIPDSENAAVIYTQAFKEIPSGTWRRDDDTITDFLKQHRANDPKLEKQSREIIGRYGKLLRAYEIAVKRPKCRFKLQWSDGLGMDYPHTGRFRFGIRLLCAKAIIEAREGRAESAARFIETAIRAADSLKDEPALINYLARIASLRVSVNNICDVLSYCNLSQDQSRKLYNMLAQINLSNSCSNALKGERAIVLMLYDWIRRGNINKMIGDKMQQRDLQSLRRLRGFLGIWLGPDEECCMRVMGQQIGIVDRPYRDYALRKLGVSESSCPWYAMIARTFVVRVFAPVIPHIVAARDETIAAISANQIILALRIYKNRYGSYPKTLNDLKSKIGWKLSNDPFSGKPLVYKPKGQGFLLYSIGKDLKDDGGKAVKKDKSRGLTNPDTPAPPEDIFWTLER